MPRPNDGGTAFPAHAHEVSPGKWCDTTPGMTLRDWFAGQALAAIDWGEHEQREIPSLADGCYFIADAMLAEREKET